MRYPRIKIGIKWKTLFYFLIIILVTISAISWIAVRVARDGVVKEINQNFEKIAEEIHFSVEALLINALEDTQIIATDPVIRSETLGSEAKLARLLRFAEIFKVYEDITLIDVDGAVITSTNYKYRGAWQYKSWFQGAINGSSTISSLQVLDDQKIVLSFTGPIRNDGGSIVGVVSLQLDISEIWQLLDHLRIGETGFAFLLDDQKRIIAHPDKDLIFSKPGRSLTGSLDEESGLLHYVEGDGKNVIGAIFPRPETVSARSSVPVNWRVVVVQDELEAFAVLDSIVNNLLIFAAVFLLFAVALSLRFSSTITRPIVTLRDIALQISSGKFDTKMPDASADEIGDLTTAFNEMVARLKQSHKDLEKKVEKRTKELEERVLINKQQLAELTRLNEELSTSTGLLIRRDLELTRANERLRTFDQMKSDFVSTATHQMRTPLSGIKWTLSMLLKGDVGPLTNEQRTFLMKTYESNDRMLALLSDLLLSDKIDSGKLQSLPEASTILPDLLDNVLTEMQPLAVRQHITLQFVDRKDSYPSVKIGAQDMRAVLQNLIENAVKYTRPGGTVKIKVQGDVSGHMRIAVSDTGIGIPTIQQKNIFSRFFRGANAAKMEPDGSGLGLFIAKGIVEKYGGTVEFQSKEGEGTTFHVELPIIKK